MKYFQTEYQGKLNVIIENPKTFERMGEERAFNYIPTEEGHGGKMVQCIAMNNKTGRVKIVICSKSKVPEADDRRVMKR